jgi:hypothetical protein
VKALLTINLWVGLYFSLIKTKVGNFMPDMAPKSKKNKVKIFSLSA